MERRIAVRGIIAKDNKVLAVRHKDANGNEVDFWAIPGGGLDPLESLRDGLRREILEELGVVPKIGNLLFVQQYNDEKREYLEFFFHIENTADYANIDISSTTHGSIELSCCEFVNPRKERILPSFLQTIDISKAILEAKSIPIENYL